MPETILLIGDSYSDQDLYYKTHFLAGDPFIFLEQDGRSLLVVSPMERGRAEKESIAGEVKDWDEYGYMALVRESGDREGAFITVLTKIVDETDARPLVVDRHFPVLYADELRQRGVQLEVRPNLFRDQRRQKSAQEIEAMQGAQSAAERATARAIEIIAQSEDHHGILHYAGIPLTSERLRAEVEVGLTREGMDVSQSPIVAGGPGAADPHWTGTGPFKAGESIVLDIFPRSKSTRYWGDMTRTVVKGEPADMLRRMFDAAIRAHEAALGEIRAGANGRDVHLAADKVFKDAGFSDETGPRFIHSTGHGVGLDIHEAPSLGMIDVELLEGDVVTVEPGLYDPTLGAVRVEDMVVVTKDGYRNLNSLPKQFEV